MQKFRYVPLRPYTYEGAQPSPEPDRILPETALWSDQKLAQWRAQLRLALDADRFVDWLTDFSLDQVVGYARQPAKDPIAIYLQDVVPWLDCEVGANEIWIDLQMLPVASSSLILLQHEATRPNLGGFPDWVRSFVQTIDRDCSEPATGRNWPITARQCIQIMLSRFSARMG